MQSLITLEGVSLELSNGTTLFDHIHFSLNAPLTGLVGANGTGKTSLAKIIAGELALSSGKITRKVALSFFKQRENAPAISVSEYLSMHYSWSVQGEKLLENIDDARLCDTLSGGEWMRVRLAAILNDQFLILDEPSNDLDLEGKEILIHFMRHYKNGILLISHDRQLLELCHEILELSNLGLTKYGGGFSFYENEKTSERDRAELNLKKAQKEKAQAKKERIELLAKQEKRNNRGKKKAQEGGLPRILLGGRKGEAEQASGKINVATLEKAQEKVKNASNLFEQMKKENIMFAQFSGKSFPSQKLIAEANEFNIFFKEKPLYLKNLNFSWRGPRKIAIKGKNGSGKSTLIKAILGKSFESTHGSIKLGGLVTLYIDQACSLLDNDKNIFENIRSNSKMSDDEIRNALAQFLFFGDKVFQKIKDLSGGERLRAALASSLLSHQAPELLILDEPTNNLDLANIEFLENFISQFQGAVLLISHDEFFFREM